MTHLFIYLFIGDEQPVAATGIFPIAKLRPTYIWPGTVVWTYGCMVVE